MIRGYVAVVSSDLPLSQVPAITADTCRKATIRLVHEKNNNEFYIKILHTDYSFKVGGNIRVVDKDNIAKGVVHIGFIIPNLDIMISCNPGDLEAFLYTVEAVKVLTVLPPVCPDKGKHNRILRIIDTSPKVSQYQHYHNFFRFRSNWSSEIDVCEFCCYRVLECYNVEDTLKTLNTWKVTLKTLNTWKLTDYMPIYSITVTSYPYMRKIDATNNNLVEIPEALGLLPCLTLLNLSDNQLGEASNWNWLTSPFIRQNLRYLNLDGNELSTIPEHIVGLRNLVELVLSYNCLTELPASLGNLKYLRLLYIEGNNLVIMPTWMYRKKRFWKLSTDRFNFEEIVSILEKTANDDFSRAENMYNSKLQLNFKDFETPAVPSLFQTVAKYIITDSLPFWEYNIPTRLVDYLEAAYYCRCGSVVFSDSIGHVVRCVIQRRDLEHTNSTLKDNMFILREDFDDELFFVCDDDDLISDDDFHYYDYDNVAIDIQCCSYECYKLINQKLKISFKLICKRHLS